MDSKKHVFTASEKETFLNILKKYSGIIEKKDTDGATLRAKNESWDRITREYNSSPYSTIQVTKKQLRRLRMNLRHRQKGELALATPLPSTNSFQQPHTILETEYPVQQLLEEQAANLHADTLQELEIEMLKEKIKEARAKTREAEAKADLAEFILRQHLDGERDAES